MVLRANALKQRLAKLDEIISELEKLKRFSADEIMSHPERMWATERGLHLAAEAVLDSGNHILSAHYGIHAADYEDILAQLKRKSVITSALYTQLKGLGGFRNILVHGYLRLDPQLVVQQLREAPKKFSRFALAINKWLQRHHSA